MSARAPRSSRGRRGAVAVPALLAAFVAAAMAVGVVVGHAGYIDLIVTPPIVEPGDEITIQGQALWTELPVDVDLVHADGGTRRIGRGMTAPDGSLSMTAIVPDGIPDGAYQVVVVNPYGESDHGSVVVRASYPTAVIAAGLVIGALGLLAILRLGHSRRSAAGPDATPTTASGRRDDPGTG